MKVSSKITNYDTELIYDDIYLKSLQLSNENNNVNNNLLEKNGSDTCCCCNLYKCILNKCFRILYRHFSFE